jgi:tRNA(Ile2) C34 agmatinyltransferase TiaS
MSMKEIIADVRRAEDEQASSFGAQSRANGPACKRCGNMMSLNAGGKCYQCNHCGDQDGGCGGN